MRKILTVTWAVLCVVPSVIPGWFLFVYEYEERSATETGWELGVVALIFWGSLAVAAVLAAVNLIILAAKPTLLGNRRVAASFLGLTLVPFVMAAALLLFKIPC